MDPIRIDIPAAKPDPNAVGQLAGKIIVEAIREAGMDPRKAYGVPMVRACLGAWGRGEYTRADFVRACRNMVILNPSLAAE